MTALLDALAPLGFGAGGWGRPLAWATGVTLALSAAGFALGLALGLVLTLARLSRTAALRHAALTYTTVVRGVPELLILYFVYFGGSAAVTEVAALLTGGQFVAAPAFLTGVIALAAISGGYNAEVLRGAWAAVDPGQSDAAAALGLRRPAAIALVILPQLLRLALPGLGNVWQLVLKGSALISLTGLVELMRQAVVAANAEADPFLFYGAAALIYLALSVVTGRAFAWAERRTDWDARAAA